MTSNQKRARLVALLLEIKRLDSGEFQRLWSEVKRDGKAVRP
jgi:hypothetical protein